MNEMISCGCDYREIDNKQYKTVNTEYANRIINGLEQSGISYSAKYNSEKISLMFSSADIKRLENIIERSSKTPTYDVIEREKKPQGESNYIELLPEIAQVLNVSVSSLQNRPIDIQMMLAQIYINNYYADNIAIKEALGQVVELNTTTENEIAQAKQIEISANNTPERRKITNEEEKILSNSAAVEQINLQEQRQNIMREEQRTAYISRRQRYRIAQSIQNRNKSSVQQEHSSDEMMRKK